MPERVNTSSILTVTEKLCLFSLLIIIAGLLISDVMSVLEGRVLYFLMIVSPILTSFVFACYLNSNYLQKKVMSLSKNFAVCVDEKSRPLTYAITKTIQDIVDSIVNCLPIGIFVCSLFLIVIFSAGLVWLINSFN